MSDLLELPWTVAREQVSAKEYTHRVAAAVRALNPALNAFLHVADDPAPGMLPIALKDNIVTTDAPTTCGSRMPGSFRSSFDATVVERLRSSGATIIGKTNMDEFAMGSSNENSAFGPVRNPWDLTRVSGGSSGGSAAAVAARMVPVALGSETGGSVRQPAAFCGVVGLKPTYGRVSRSGLVAFGSSLDQIGIFSKTVRDAAEVLGIIAGHDPLDATSARVPVDDYRSGIEEGVRGKRFGVLREAVERMEGEVLQNFQAAVRVLESGGAIVETISIPSVTHAIAVYYVIANAEASANLARFDGVRFGHRSEAAHALDEVFALSRAEGFGEEVKRRIMIGTFVLSSGYYDAYYARAQRVRDLMRQELAAAFHSVDFLITPTTPEPAFVLGAKADPLSMYLSDIFTAPANLTGIPAIAVPSGFTAAGLPLSLQIMAPQFAERALLSVAAFYEDATAFWRLPVPVGTPSHPA